ncbi:MAG: hypothetical protein AB7O65_10890 [Candidatus Korobacteraceae bacterium]
MAQNKKKSGRPPKFEESRRPVTVTLPESTLERLATIHPDRAHAIVKAVEFVLGREGVPSADVELAEVIPGVGVILVGPSKYLRKLKWLRMIEVSPSRFLLAFPTGTSVDSLEVAILDLLDTLETTHENAWERSLLERLRDLIRPLRREGLVSKAELLFVDTAKSRLGPILSCCVYQLVLLATELPIVA